MYALYNFYLYFIAFLYAPHMGGDYDGRKSGNGRSNFDVLEAERERQQIMSEFYETEMNETTDDIHIDDKEQIIKTSGGG